MTTMISSECTPAVATDLPKVSVTVDTKGRVRTSREQRRLILSEFERSGVSAARFAQRTGLKYSTLAGWLQRYRRSQRRSPSVRLLEAVVAPSGTSSALTVHLPGGARLEIREESQLALAAALVRALDQPTSAC